MLSLTLLWGLEDFLISGGALHDGLVDCISGSIVEGEEQLGSVLCWK